MKILLLGPQGCGKGTIGQMLSDKLNLPFVSAGDLLRALLPESPHYKIIKDQMKEGALPDNHIVGAIVQQEIERAKYANGFILDGWCRRITDVTIFDPGFDVVIVFDMSYETSVKRVSGRRTCSTDGKTYNIYTLPKEELEKCKGELTQRADDTEEAVKRRLGIYYSETMEVVKHFEDQNKAIHINAEPLPEVIFSELMSKLHLPQ